MVSGPDEVSVIADSSQLHRVLSNLVANAIRHSPIGESVCIDVDGAMRRISVLDNGAGFDADFVNEAFQPFRRQDEARERSHGGAGLGLAVSKGIIEALDGKIWAEPGPGGAVHVELPA